MSNPNLFIVGAAKCGTTSIAALLGAQQDIYLPSIKEPSPFAEGYNHRARFPDPYLSLYEPGKGLRYRLDASTPHLSTTTAAGKIRAHFPDSKIVILLRDPVKRAFSLYNWMRREGYEPLSSFESALAAEASRRETHRQGSPQYYHNYLYRESGLYDAQVARYQQAFPAEQLCLIVLDAPGADGATVIRRLESFLGISIQANVLPRLNEAKGVHSGSLQYRIRHQLQKPGSESRPFPGKGRLIHLLDRLNRSASISPLRPETAADLRETYRADISELARRLNCNLDHWLA